MSSGWREIDVVPRGVRAHHRVEDGEELSHARGQRDLLRLAGREEAPIERAEHRVAARADERAERIVPSGDVRERRFAGRCEDSLHRAGEDESSDVRDVLEQGFEAALFLR